MTRRSVEQALRAFFAEFVNDPKARETLRQARGFCPEHTQLLATLGDALAVSILYADLAQQTQERWRGGGRKTRTKVFEALFGYESVSCPACVQAEEAQARYIGALVAGMSDERLWTALESGSGFCVAHAEQVMAKAPAAHAARLCRLEIARLAALQAELEETIRKNDYRFRGEVWGAEKDAWLRALQKLNRP